MSLYAVFLYALSKIMSYGPVSVANKCQNSCCVSNIPAVWSDDWGKLCWALMKTLMHPVNPNKHHIDASRWWLADNNSLPWSSPQVSQNYASRRVSMEMRQWVGRWSCYSCSTFAKSTKTEIPEPSAWWRVYAYTWCPHSTLMDMRQLLKWSVNNNNNNNNKSLLLLAKSRQK